MSASELTYRHSPAHASRDRARRRWPWYSVAAAAIVGLVVLYTVTAIHSGPRSSDGATLVLQGQSMAHGNVLLHRWNLSEDSFWLLDALFNGVGYVFVGVRPGLLFVIPAVVAALVVAMGVLIATDGRRGAAAGAGAATVVIVLAFPTHTLAYFLLQGGLHILTTAAALIAFYALRRGRFGAGWIVAVVVLAAASLSDLQILAYGTFPIFLAGLVAAIRQRSWRPAWVPVSAAAASGFLAVAVRLVALAIGTFSMASINPKAPWPQMRQNIRHLVTVIANFLGVRNGALGTGGVPRWLQACHDIAAAVIVVCCALALLRLVTGLLTGRSDGAWWQSDKGGWVLDDMLVIACFGPAATFVYLTLSSTDMGFLRYATATVLFAAVLTGRVVARGYDRASRRVTVRAGSVALAAAVVLTAAAGTGYTFAQPVPAQRSAPLASFLQAHGLTRGLGDYWGASITTVQSKGRVAIRPVITGPDGKLVPYERESYDGWFAGTFQFVVSTRTDPTGSVDAKTIRASWGPATHVYSVGIYTVRVWSHRISFADQR